MSGIQQALLASVGAVSGIRYVGGYVVGIPADSGDVTVTLTSLTGGLATQPSTGDLVIVYFGTASLVDRNLVVAGYTSVADLYANDDIDTNLEVAHKTMSSPADTSFVLTGGTLNNSDNGTIAVQVWRNVGTLVTPVGTATAINTVRPTPPAANPNVAGSYIVVGGAGARNNNDPGTYSSSDLTAFITADQTSNDRSSVIGIGYKQWISGTFTPAQFTWSTTDSTSYSCASATIILRP